jgi:hypothetical protein
MSSSCTTDGCKDRKNLDLDVAIASTVMDNLARVSPGTVDISSSGNATQGRNTYSTYATNMPTHIYNLNAPSKQWVSIKEDQVCMKLVRPELPDRPHFDNGKDCLASLRQ